MIFVTTSNASGHFSRVSLGATLTLVNCRRCTSNKVMDLEAELAIHFPGLKGIDIPHVFVSPKLIICLECGLAEFSIPETELRRLRISDCDPR